LQAVDRDTLDGWLRRGLSVDDIAGRSGHGVTGVSQLLRRFDLTPPQGSGVGADPVRGEPVVAELVRSYRDEGASPAGGTGAARTG